MTSTCTVCLVNTDSRVSERDCIETPFIKTKKGVYIKKGETQEYIAAHLRNIADVSGAGDTVISIATLCLVAGVPINLIAEISNIAGGLVCEKSGVVSIDKEQLLVEVEELLRK